MMGEPTFCNLCSEQERSQCHNQTFVTRSGVERIQVGVKRTLPHPTSLCSPPNPGGVERFAPAPSGSHPDDFL